MPPSRAHRKGRYAHQEQNRFRQPGRVDLVCARPCVPVVEREYVLACGRTELFKSFYEVRKQEFPAEYMQDLARIQILSEPNRTDSLERLNERIFAGLTELLFHEAQPKRVREPQHSLPFLRRNRCRSCSTI